MKIESEVNSSINQPVNSLETDQTSLIPLLEANSPDFLWIADKPISLGGVPKKVFLDEIREKFKFEYNENILVSNKLISKLKPDDQPENEQLLEKINYRLQNPLNDKLVVCLIDNQVGYGVFANEFIEAGTIIGIYAGKIEEISERNDYGMSIAGTELRINAEQYGGITRFIQHMPFSINSMIKAIQNSTKDSFLRIMDANSLDLPYSKTAKLNDHHLELYKNLNIPNLKDLTQEEQKEMLENKLLNKIENLGTANIRSFTINYKNKPIIYLKACCDIQKGEQLGITYGQEYWIKKGIIPQYFDNNGSIISRRLYVPTLNHLLEKYTPSDAEGTISKNDTLHRAAFGGDIYDVKLLLLEYDASIDDQNEDANGHQRTPLHMAVIGYAYAIAEKRNDIEERKAVIKLLIDRNADRDAKDKMNRTVLHYAVMNGLKDIVEILLGFGIFIDGKDIKGKKAFDYNIHMAMEIFQSNFKERRSDLISRYEYIKVLKNKTGRWIEGETGRESVAGLYTDKVITSKIIIFFGEKDNKHAISMINYNNKNDLKAIKSEKDFFDNITDCLICQRSQLLQENSFHDLYAELEKYSIEYQIVNIEENNDIIVAHYNYQEGNFSPRYVDLNDADLKYFYGELINHSETNVSQEATVKAPTKSTQSPYKKLGVETLGAENQKQSILIELHRITGNDWACNTDGTKFWMTADKTIVNQIIQLIGNKNIGQVRKNKPGTSIFIDNPKLSSLKEIMAIKDLSSKNEVSNDLKPTL